MPSTSKSAPAELDLSTLKSYSPDWPASLRYAVCIATKYAGQRLAQRAKALVAGPLGSDEDEEGADLDEDGKPIASTPQARVSDEGRKAKDYVAAWDDFAQKFLRGTCQHLGVDEEALPSGEIRLQDVVEAGQGRATGEGEGDEVDLLRREQDQGAETGSIFWRRYAGQRAKRSDAVEELKVAKEEEKKEQQQEDQAAPRDAEKEMEEAFEEKVKVDEGPREEEPPRAHREGGALTSAEGQGRDFEVFNELLLVALGLGQYRAQDGATTLFEQEAIFDEPTGVPSSSSASQLQAQPAAQPQPPNQASEEPEPASDAAPLDKAWGSIRRGAASSWRWTSDSANKVGNAVASSTSRAQEAQQPGERKAKQAVKPNDVCHYDARARAIIFTAGAALGVESKVVYDSEKALSQTIHFVMEEARSSAKEQGKKDPLQEPEAQRGHGSATGDGRTDWMNKGGSDAVEESKKSNWKKWAAASGGFAIGGVILGVTGGLAAPLVVPALAGLTGITFLATSGGVIMLGALVGVTGGGLAGYRVHRRLRGLESFEFQPVKTAAREAELNIASLHATICVSGLLLREEEQLDAWTGPWTRSTESRDVYVVSSEAKLMAEAGQSLRRYVLASVTKQVGSRAAQEVAKRTVLAPLAALTLPVTVAGALGAGLDSLFVRAKSKAVKQGLILAETLKAEVQGHRPVVLIGASLGAVSVLSCLSELAKDPEANCHLIDSVYLICAPCTSGASTLRRARSVVARRFVNAYSSKRGDMVCGIAAWLGMELSVEDVRKGKAGLPRVLGSSPLAGVAGLENVDVGEILGGSHFDWTAKTEEVLRFVGALDA